MRGGAAFGDAEQIRVNILELNLKNKIPGIIDQVVEPALEFLLGKWVFPG